MDVKFHDGLPKRWENKCLDCYSSANLDFSLMLPVSWGQGVYKAWVWSEDCGFKPNGHTICHLLPKIIKPPILGQTLRLYLDSHRVRRSWYSTVISLVYKSKMISYFFAFIQFSYIFIWVNLSRFICVIYCRFEFQEPDDQNKTKQPKSQTTLDNSVPAVPAELCSD